MLQKDDMAAQRQTDFEPRVISLECIKLNPNYIWPTVIEFKHWFHSSLDSLLNNAYNLQHPVIIKEELPPRRKIHYGK
jgi:hypothetical protein